VIESWFALVWSFRILPGFFRTENFPLACPWKSPWDKRRTFLFTARGFFYLSDRRK
jgi:hypothetical protein